MNYFTLCKQNLVAITSKVSNYYNWVKPHKGIDGLTPGEKLINYFYHEKLKITLAFLTLDSIIIRSC